MRDILVARFAIDRRLDRTTLPVVLDIAPIVLAIGAALGVLRIVLVPRLKHVEVEPGRVMAEDISVMIQSLISSCAGSCSANHD